MTSTDVVSTAHGAPDVAELQGIARRVRRHVITSVAHAGAGHIGGPLSAADILVALYFRILNIRPDEPAWPGRDRFIMSKGHSAIGQYAAMALRGYFPVAELETFDQLDSRLQGHPDMTRLPGIDMSTGSLGMGLSAGIGIALGGRLRGGSEHTYVLLGDGECQEGQVWEAAFVAARYQLDNITAIVDANDLQQYGWAGAEIETRQAPWGHEALARQWAAFGWAVHEADGHDFADIERAIGAARLIRGGPAVVIARTTKGKGVSFMEGRFDWHARVPTQAELAAALEELDVA
jgi:transketolase